jgi:hypothetical protein
MITFITIASTIYLLILFGMTLHLAHKDNYGIVYLANLVALIAVTILALKGGNLI